MYKSSIKIIIIYCIIVIETIFLLINCHTRVKYDYRDKKSKWYLSDEKVKKIQDRIIKEFYIPITGNDHIIYARYSLQEVTYKQEVIIYKIDFSRRKEFYIKNFNTNPRLFNETNLTESELKEIVQLFRSYQFQNVPPMLPMGQAKRYKPSYGVFIGFREKPETDLKIIQADMTADYQYYPDGFFQFSEALEKILRDLDLKGLELRS